MTTTRRAPATQGTVWRVFGEQFQGKDDRSCLACFIRATMYWSHWRTSLTEGDEIRCTDCHSTLRVIDN